MPQPPHLVRPHQLADDSPVLHLQFAEAAGSYNYGKWWHSWIEMFPWSGGLGQWGIHAAAALPPIAYRERAEKEIAALLANEELHGLCRNAAWFQPEFPFSWPRTAQDWYEGVIDLLIGIKDGTLYVIDWKTNQAALNESTEELAQHIRAQYLPQLETYREALQSMMEDRKIEIANDEAADHVTNCSSGQEDVHVVGSSHVGNQSHGSLLVRRKPGLDQVDKVSHRFGNTPRPARPQARPLTRSPGFSVSCTLYKT